MESEEGAAYLRTLRGVLQFLEDNGFDKAVEAVYQQLDEQQAGPDERIQEHGGQGGDQDDLHDEEEEEQDASPGGSAPVNDFCDGSSSSEEEQRSKSADARLPSQSVWAQENRVGMPRSGAGSTELTTAGSSDWATLSRRHSGSRRHWELPDLDEYQSVDDVGYYRRPIARQQEFIMHQLELEPGASDRVTSTSPAMSSPAERTNSLKTPLPAACAELVAAASGSARAAELGAQRAASYSASSPASPLGQSEGGARGAGSDSDSVHSTASFRSPSPTPASSTHASSPALASPPVSAHAHAGGSHQEGPSQLARGAAERDAWELGPSGITFAEPVCTPTKAAGSQRSSSADGGEGGRRAGLTRVESLSNSFIEEGEDADDEGNPCSIARLSDAGSLDPASGGPASTAGAADDIDLCPPLVASTSQVGGVSSGNGDVPLFGALRSSACTGSRHSSLDVLVGSIAGGTPSDDGASERASRGAASSRANVTSPSGTCGTAAPAASGSRVRGPRLSAFELAVATGMPAVAKDGSGAAGGASGPGGFSFPVTPPTEEEEAELEGERGAGAQHVFSTWASTTSRASMEPADSEALEGLQFTLGKLTMSSSAPIPTDSSGGGAPERTSSNTGGLQLQQPSSSGGGTAPSGSSGAAMQDKPASELHVPTSSAGAKVGASRCSPTQQALTGAASVSPSAGAEPVSPNALSDPGAANASHQAAGTRAVPRAGVLSHPLALAGTRSEEFDAELHVVGPSSAASPKTGAAQSAMTASSSHARLAVLAKARAPASTSGGSIAGAAPASARSTQTRSLPGDMDAGSTPPVPRYVMDEAGNVIYEYDQDYVDNKYEVFDLRIVHRRRRTGFEESKDFPIRKNDLIAGRYQVMDFLGSAAFSQAVQALDIGGGGLVCLKIIKNNKDYFDQSLDEIKLLRYVNAMDPADEASIVRMYDYFYYKEHLIIVCELLRANLYEFQRYQRETGDAPYFTLPRIQRIAVQVLRSLAFLHGLGLIHSDLKPENILIKSYSRCEVKVIDLGSSCFTSDRLSSYVQSRSYRAPEVILGLRYGQKVDIWSLGAILAELSSGCVLFQNDSLPTLLARLEGILGPLPEWMLAQGRYAPRYYTRSRDLYERSPSSGAYELLVPKRTSLRHRIPHADEGFLDFVSYLLTLDPDLRPTAEEALQHPWLAADYGPLDPMQD